MREHGVGATDVELMDITSANSKGAPSDAVKFPNYVRSWPVPFLMRLGLRGDLLALYRQRPAKTHHQILRPQ
ncbi:Uncharacterised protein [Edwardsiella tarda]|nr:Uncharacterised protein [Edwardsiella tarda]